MENQDTQSQLEPGAFCGSLAERMSYPTKESVKGSKESASNRSAGYTERNWVLTDITSEGQCPRAWGTVTAGPLDPGSFRTLQATLSYLPGNGDGKFKLKKGFKEINFR